MNIIWYHWFFFFYLWHQMITSGVHSPHGHDAGRVARYGCKTAAADWSSAAAPRFKGAWRLFACEALKQGSKTKCTSSPGDEAHVGFSRVIQLRITTLESLRTLIEFECANREKLTAQSLRWSRAVSLGTCSGGLVLHVCRALTIDTVMLLC